MAMDVQISSSVSLSSELNSPVGFDKQRLEEFIAEGSLEFDEWTSLISEIERSCSDDIEMISLVYDSFLVEFPLCYGYWRKYADHKARFCTIDKVVEVFERAVQSATYSVDMWFHYCSFGMLAFEDPCDVCRLFKRGLSIVGKDYLCHMLWDKYIEFEISQQHWSSLALIYVQTLRFPSKKLRLYYDSFKKLAASWKEELECQIDSAIEFQSELVLEGEVSTYYKDDKISCVIKDLLDPSVSCLVRSKALQKYLFFGEQIFKEARQFDEKVNCFETHIRRPYFHVKPLDDRQLKNWHDYLNFAEKQGDFDWVVKLHERCLIPCANYPEFWMRYADFMESKGGREIANFALARATQIFLKRLPVIHLFNARYKEQIGDTTAARAAFLESDIDSDSRFIENITNKANMEKRLGNIVAACNIYKEALETAKENRKLHTLPLLYVHFSRLTYMNTDSADTARDILIDGIKHVPHSKLLLEELIKFTMMHGGPRHMNIVDAIISNSLYSGSDVLRVFSLKDVEDISSLYLQFVDLCGTIHDVRNAWNRHFKLFPRTVRIAYGCPARETKSLRTFIVGRRERIVASPPQPSESEHLMHSPSQDKKLSPPEKHDAESDHAATSLLSNQKSPLRENHDTQSNGAEDDIFQSGEADGSFQERMQQVHPEATEQHSQHACKPGVLSVDLVHPDANENEAVQASDEFSKEDVQQEYGHESKQDLKSLSLEGLYLDPVGNDSPGSLCVTSHECEAPQEANLSHEIMLNDAVSCETSMSDGSVLGGGQNNNLSHFPSSSMGTQAFSSAPVKTGIVSSSSSAGHQNFIPEARSPPQKPANSDRNWHPKHNPDRVLRDSRFGFQGHSNKRQYQQRQFSSQRYPRPETGAQMPMNPGYPPQPLPSPNPQPQLGSQAQSQLLASPNLTATQGWEMQNMQQQNFAPASQSEIPTQPVFYPQAHMSQYPTQSSEQHPQNNLAYNQMWQYYYYQQQQQQFFLQQQQLQLQQQHLQPLQQQQFLQQEYQQQHQVLLPLQQQQLLPPMQQQPHQQQQQHLLYMQQQTQQQVQQQDQQPLQQQQQQEQRQSEQQISVSEIETWNNNCSKQDQGVQPLGVVAFANTSAALPSPLPSPHLHQQSPQGR